MRNHPQDEADSRTKLNRGGWNTIACRVGPSTIEPGDTTTIIESRRALLRPVGIRYKGDLVDLKVKAVYIGSYAQLPELWQPRWGTSEIVNDDLAYFVHECLKRQAKGPLPFDMWLAGLHLTFQIQNVGKVPRRFEMDMICEEVR